MSGKKPAQINSDKSGQIDYSFLLLALIFLTCLFMTAQVLDATLIPRFFLLSVGSLAICYLILKKSRNLRFDFDLVNFALPAFFLLSFLSCIWAHNTSEAYFDSLRILLGLCMFFFTLFYLKDNKNFELNLAATVSAVSVIYSIGALAQLVELNSFQLRAIYSVTSLAGHKNLLSSFLFLTLPFSLYGILKSGNNWKYLFYPASIFTFVLIVVLQTRAVWLGLQVALLLALLVAAIKFRRVYFQQYRRIFLYSGICILVLLTIPFLLEAEIILSVRERINFLQYVQSESAQERLALWEKSLLLAKDAFPLGVGAGNWQIMFTRYSVEGIGSAMSDNVTFQRPHNDFLWVLSETGVAGIILYLVFFIALLFYALRVLLKNELNTDRVIILIFTATLAGFLIISFFDFPRERIEIMMVFYAGMAVLYHRILKTTAVFQLFSVNVKRQTLLFPAMALLFFSLLISFSRWKGEHNMKKVYAYRQKGDWASVIKYCDKASSSFYQIDPTTIPVSWYKGLAYFSSGNFRQALAEYTVAKTISPYNHYILNDLGSALEKLGRHEEAKEHYKQALKINRHFDDPKLNLAAIYYNEKNYPEAWSWTIQVNDRHPRKALFVQTIKPFIKASVK